MKEINSCSKKLNRRKLLAGVGGIGATALAGCAGNGADDSEVQAAFVFDGQIGDQGWIHSHNLSRELIEDENDWLDTSFQEDVSPEEAERVINDFVEAGFDIIFTTSESFEEQTARAAENHPDTYFESCNGFETADNLSRYGVRVSDGRYCIGAAAGLLTETDRLGMIAGFPVPLAFRDINAFALGAQSTNPDAEVEVRFTNSWFAPQDATTIVNDFASDDIDVVCSNLDDTGTVSTANDVGIWGSGIYSSMSDAGGDWYLSSPIASWEAIYEDRCRAVRNDEWETQEVWVGMNEGAITLDDFGPEVPEEAVEAAFEARDGIQSGDVNIWEGSQFEDQDAGVGGPIETQMDEYVDSVVGSPP